MYLFDISTDENGMFLWEWKAPNGNVMMRSPKTYNRREGVMAAILLIQQNVSNSTIRDQTSVPVLLRRA